MRTYKQDLDETKYIMLRMCEAAERVSLASKRKERIIWALGAVVIAQWFVLLRSWI
jgi:hypothetical protein